MEVDLFLLWGVLAVICFSLLRLSAFRCCLAVLRRRQIRELLVSLLLCLHDALASLLLDLVGVAGAGVNTLADVREVCVVDAPLAEADLVVSEILAPLDPELLALLCSRGISRVLLLLFAEFLVGLALAWSEA